MSLPDAPDQLFQTDASWTLQDCVEVLDHLQSGLELSFYAADHSSPSDPGAYVRVQRTEAQILLRKVANHGWSSHWQRVEPSVLRDELYRNRSEQFTGVKLAQALHAVTEGQR